MEILPRSKKSAILGLILVNFIWAIAVPITKQSLGQFPPFTLLFLRFSLSAFVLTPVFLIDDLPHPIKLRHTPIIILLAFLGPFLSNALFYIGIKETTASDASIIGAVFPVLNMIAAGIFLRERSAVTAWIGALIAFSGTLAIIGEPMLRGQGLVFADGLKGNIIIAASVVTWTAFVILSKKIANEFSSLTLTALYMVFSALLSVPFLILEAQNTHLDFVQKLTGADLASLAFLVIGASVTAYLVMEWSFEKVSAQLAGYLSFIQPSVAVLASFLILKEIPSNFFYLGSAMVVLGVFLIFRKSSPIPKRHHRL